MRIILIPASAIANNALTIRDFIGRDEIRRGRGKRKVSTRNFKGEYVKTRCLRNECFRSSAGVLRERDERRKEETEKHHGAFHSIVGFSGKRFLFPPPPPTSFLFFYSLSLFLSPTFAQKLDRNVLLAFVLYSRRLFGSLYVSGKLPTYPSPKPISKLTSQIGQNVSLGEE